jgi:hypothetical protein
MKGENQRSGRSWTVAEYAALAIAFLAALSVTWNQIHTMSGDTALHYWLAQHIAETWRWPSGDMSFPPDMRNYPPLSHYLAALLGTVTGSTLLAMNLITIGCVFGCYSLLTRGVIGSARASLAALALVAIGLLVARSQHAAEGFEVDFYYFYPQLVAELVFLLFAFWLCQTRLPWPWRLAVTAVATFMACWLYLIAAVEIALACICLEGLILLRKILAARTVRLAWLVPVITSGLVLPLIIAVNPALRFMVTDASTEGGNQLRQLHLGAFEHLVPALAAGLLVVAGAIGVLSRADAPRWRGGALFLATAGCATAVAALTQALVQTVSPLGSDYAMNKYGFSVITILVFAVAAATALWIDRRAQRGPSWAWASLAPAALAALATVFMHAQPGERLDEFVKYQKAVRAFFAEKRAPADAFGHTSSGNPLFRYPLNHVVTLVDLGMETKAAQKSTDASLNVAMTPPETYSFVDDQVSVVPPKCVLGRLRSGIAFVSLPCERATPQGLALDKTVSVAGPSNRPPYFISGWSGTEPTGIWSGASRAVLGLHLDSLPDPVLVTVQASGFLPTPAYAQRVPVFVHGVQLDTWTFDARSPAGARTVVVPAALAPDGNVLLEFRFPDATSPAKYGPSADGRLLAMFVSGFSASARYPTISRGQTVSLANAAAAPPYFKSGWSGKEPTAIWSDGDRATLALHADKVKAGEPLTVSIDGQAFLAHPDSAQTVIVRSGGRALATWRYDKAAPAGVRKVKVPADLVHNGDLELELDFPDAVSPAQQKVSGDPRRLGLYVSALTVD